MDIQSESQKAAQAFGRILEHIAQQLEAVNHHMTDEEDKDMLPHTLQELSQAFMEKSGFMFSKEQALSLSYAFEIISQSCYNLASMAKKNQSSEQTTNIFSWAADQAKSMGLALAEKHKAKEGGVISFDDQMQTKLTQAIGGTAEWENQDKTES